MSWSNRNRRKNSSGYLDTRATIFFYNQLLITNNRPLFSNDRDNHFLVVTRRCEAKKPRYHPSGRKYSLVSPFYERLGGLWRCPGNEIGDMLPGGQKCIHLVAVLLFAVTQCRFKPLQPGKISLRLNTSETCRSKSFPQEREREREREGGGRRGVMVLIDSFETRNFYSTFKFYFSRVRRFFTTDYPRQFKSSCTSSWRYRHRTHTVDFFFFDFWKSIELIVVLENGGRIGKENGAKGTMESAIEIHVARVFSSRENFVRFDVTWKKKKPARDRATKCLMAKFRHDNRLTLNESRRYHRLEVSYPFAGRTIFHFQKKTPSTHSLRLKYNSLFYSTLQGYLCFTLDLRALISSKCQNYNNRSQHHVRCD